jgi:AcrR family transcriptional regulator
MNDEHSSIPLNADALHMGDERHERRDAAENRERVLTAARQLFEERGVAAVHMADIAERAGVGKGTLYRRFANKAELCLALLHDQLVEHQDAMLRRLQEMSAQNLPYLERIKIFLVEVVAFTERHVPLLCEAQQGGQIGGLEGDAPFFVWQHMTVQGLLQGAMNRGEISADLDLPLVVDLLLAPITASYFRYLRHRRGFSIERIGDALCDAVERLK